MKLSHQAAYAKELEGYETIETEYGFISYRFHENGVECFIRDIYVAPEYRAQGGANTLAVQLADMVTVEAKKKGCKALTGLVVPSMKNATHNVAAQLKYGFKVHSAEANKIWFLKEI